MQPPMGLRMVCLQKCQFGPKAENSYYRTSKKLWDLMEKQKFQ